MKLRNKSGNKPTTQLGQVAQKGRKNGLSAALRDQVKVSGYEAGRGVVSPDGVGVSADHVGFHKLGAQQFGAAVHHERSGLGAGLATTNAAIHHVDVNGAGVGLNRDGLDAHADHVRWMNTSADTFAAGVRSDKTGHQAGVAATDLAIHETNVHGANFHMGRGGIRADVAKVGFTNVAADQVAMGASSDSGRSAKLGASNLKIHDVGVHDADFSMGRGGIDANAGAVDFMNTSADHVAGQVTTAGGGVGQASADNLEVHKLGVRDAAFHMGTEGIDATAGQVNWTNTRLQNGQASWQGAGGTSVAAGVEQAVVHDLALQDAAFSTDLVTGDASLRKGRFVEHDLQGASLQLGSGGQTILGASGDLHASHGVEGAQANWDLSKGQMGASVDKYTHDRSLKNATINVMGEQIEIPELALHVEASGEAAVDLSDGELDLGLDLSGTSLQVGGMTVTLPEQAQLGVDVDVSKGEFNLNVAGHEVDIDGAVGKLWGGLKRLFGGGKAKSAGPQEIAQGRQAVSELRRKLPGVRDKVAAASATKG